MNTDAKEVLGQRLREACRELERRVRQGESRVAESVLVDNPDLANNSEFALELIYTEFVTLDELGKRPKGDEWVSRFPRWRERLQRLLKVDAAFGDGALDELEPSFSKADTCAGIDSTIRALNDSQRRSDGDGLKCLGPYELLEEVGRGATGVVYRARQVDLDRFVALKVIPSALYDQEQKLRFHREAESAARLHHPNIVQVYDVGEVDGIAYLSMEYIDGGSLERWLTGKPWREREAVELVAKLAEAIQFAHDLGVVHRDLKPANVLLQSGSEALHSQTPSIALLQGHPTQDAERPSASPPHERQPKDLDLAVLVPKIIDFGLAKRAWESTWQKTQTGAILGTPAYMAPEQASGQVSDVGPAADIYALGAILYELLVGRPPFFAASLLETLEQARFKEPVPPTRLHLKISRDVETICLKCLEKKPVARYATARDLAYDLGRVLEGKTIKARPTGPLERACKWAKRRPAIASLLAAVLLVTTMGAGGVLWQWKQAELRRRESEVALHDAELARNSERRHREQLSASDYFHRILLAHREFLSGNILKADQLFENCRHDPYRDWEWAYLNRLMHGNRRSLTGHSLFVYGLDFSPDSSLLASVSGRWGHDDSGSLIVWDSTSGKQRFRAEGRGPMMCVAFSPDGCQLAAGSGLWTKPGHGELRIWDVSTGTEINQLESLIHCPQSVAFNADGTQIAAAGSRLVQIWDAPFGAPSHTLTGHTGMVTEAAFSPEGRILASASIDQTIRVWDSTTQACLHILQTDSSQRTVTFSPDGRFLVAGSWNGVLRVWDAKDDFAELAAHQLYEGAILRARYTPDGQYVAVATGDIRMHLQRPLLVQMVTWSLRRARTAA